SPATARSALPSPFKSAIATEIGLPAQAKSTWVANDGVAARGAVVFNSTDTLAERLSATARSSRPSLLRSPIATKTGFGPLTLPMVKSTFGAKIGIVAPGGVVFSSTDTVPACELLTTRSGLPSLLRSPTATELVFGKTAGVAAWGKSGVIVA